MPLREGFKKLALLLQEQADAGLSTSDAIVCREGKIQRVPYSAQTLAGEAVTTLDIGKANDAIPHVTRDPETDDTKESLRTGSVVGDMKLVESAVSFIDQIRLEEATRSDYAIKLISPGKGSSAFYPAEVLKRDGPNVFKAGTQMYWNHATEAEEAARPEGNMDHLAAVLTTNAFYDEGGSRGPGLYGRAKVFADYAQKVAEKGPHTGLSIRATGNAEKGKLIEGRPVLKELTYADSVDFVTKAGAGGMVLTESARKESKIQEEEALTEMENAEVKRLQEAVKKQTQRIALWEARDFADGQIKDLRLPDAVKQRIRERALLAAPIATDGTLDEVAFKKLIETEAAEEAAYLSKLTGGRIVSGMGSATPPAPPDPIKAQEAYDKELIEIGASIGLSEAGAKTFAKGRAA